MDKKFKWHRSIAECPQTSSKTFKKRSEINYKLSRIQVFDCCSGFRIFNLLSDLTDDDFSRCLGTFAYLIRLYFYSYYSCSVCAMDWSLRKREGRLAKALLSHHQPGELWCWLLCKPPKLLFLLLPPFSICSIPTVHKCVASPAFHSFAYCQCVGMWSD